MNGTDGIALDSWCDSAREFSFGDKRIRYWTAGEGDPLLLIHGFPTAGWDAPPLRTSSKDRYR